MFQKLYNKSPKVFMIIGKSFSGKDTLLDSILADKNFCQKYNLVRLVRYTNRKPRPNEVNGETYNFISNDDVNEFKMRQKRKPDMILISSYKSAFKDLYYITDFSDVKMGYNYITVGDIESINQYKKVFGDNLSLIYLLPPDWILFKRFYDREDNLEYADLKYQEIHRRYINDLKKFALYSNEFIANCNCILFLNEKGYYNNAKTYIKKLINNEYKDTGVIVDYEPFVFSTKYKPKNIFKGLNAYEECLNGKIYICNKKLVIDINNSSYLWFQ